MSQLSDAEREEIFKILHEASPRLEKVLRDHFTGAPVASGVRCPDCYEDTGLRGGTTKCDYCRSIVCEQCLVEQPRMCFQCEDERKGLK